VKRQLKIVNGEISYLSDADDQSYGAWCPVSYDCYHRFKEGETLVVGEELEAKIKELEQAQPKWISVEDELPEPETPVLAMVNGYDGILTLERRWEICDPFEEAYFKDFLYWDWIDNDGQQLDELVSHWMPRPPQPEVK